MFAKLLTAIANEPARFGTRVVAICAAIFAVLVAFGVPVTATQTAAVTGLVSVLAATVGEWIRSVVTPTVNIPTRPIVVVDVSDRNATPPPEPTFPGDAT